LYVRFAEVRRVDAAQVSAMVERAAQPDVDRVVVDLRQNPGGDNTTYPGLLSALRDPAIDRPGRFFVIIDHVTFSAAANFATELEQSTGAVFAGEPMGGGLNFWNDVQWVTLPDYPVPMQVGVSTRYWQKATPDDPRLTIEPAIGIPSRASDYFAGRDPVLEAVLATALE
jgi:C-terminal processing protease CtpA/Prc